MFDQDPSEQAQISASDFAQMCDDMKALKESNTELLEALEAMVKANGGIAVMPTMEARKQNAAREMAEAAIAKAKGETK